MTPTLDRERLELERDRVERDRVEVGDRAPVRRPVIDRALMAVGALVALIGAYFQFAPTNWVLAHFSEAYQLAGYTFGGLSFAIGAGMYADRIATSVHRPARATLAATLALVAFVGALIAAATWIV